MKIKFEKDHKNKIDEPTTYRYSINFSYISEEVNQLARIYIACNIIDIWYTLHLEISRMLTEKYKL